MPEGNLYQDVCPCGSIEVPLDDVKTRWRSCRDQFRMELGSRGRSWDGAPKKRQYIYTKQLMFLKDIMEMRPCSDNLLNTEEEAGHEESQPVLEQHLVLPLTPEPTEPQAATQSSSQPQLPRDVDNPRTPPARRRRSQVATTGANVDSRVLEYLHRCSEEDACDAFGRAPLLRRVPDYRMARVQGSILAIIDSATPPNNPRQCFQVIEQWRGLPEESVPSTAPLPSQPANPFPRPQYQRSMVSIMSPGHVVLRDRLSLPTPDPSNPLPRAPRQGSTLCISTTMLLRNILSRPRDSIVVLKCKAISRQHTDFMICSAVSADYGVLVVVS
ncbi:uncharacterized protein LOC142749873 [Rhinoderma darwinii]|uniref:uncharacterized protein LOC142734843 n=1 Tax=Rhinoderma darwinii TaxID=43563 RepID=UPI003F663CBC